MNYSRHLCAFPSSILPHSASLPDVPPPLLFLTEMLSPQEVLLPRANAGSAFAFFFLLAKYEMLSGMPIQSVVALSL